MKGTANRNSMALMPITENEYNLRAKQELDLIKKFKKDKEAEEQIRQAINLKKQTINEKRLKEELMKRRIEIGVHQNVGGVK
jgi:uncharacterized tellurite resistance protein B-like protein